jgi:hypothetical protein
MTSKLLSLFRSVDDVCMLPYTCRCGSSHSFYDFLITFVGSIKACALSAELVSHEGVDRSICNGVHGSFTAGGYIQGRFDLHVMLWRSKATRARRSSGRLDEKGEQSN